MKKVLFYSFLLTFAIILSFSGCKKNTVAPVEESIQSSEDNALVDGEFTSIYSYLDAQSTLTLGSVAEKGGNSNIQDIQIKSDLLPVCATITWDSVARVLTIDFGTTNCLCQDGINRRGKIIATFTGKFKQVNSSINVSLENYYVNDNKVTGSKTVTYLGTGKVSIVVQHASITTANGTISWQCQRTVEMTAGINTKTIWDDEYTITGSASGTNRQGVNFSVTIDKPLIKQVICQKKDFVAGVLTIQNDKG